MKAIGDPDQHFQCDLNPSLKFKQISRLTLAILMQRHFENSSCLLPKEGYANGRMPLPISDFSNCLSGGYLP